MRIASITAGASGMFCGSCMKDNTLAVALNRLGYPTFLIPTYTPITTDEASIAQEQVFMGGINVYLQEKVGLFRYTPRWIDQLFDWPRLLRWVGRFAAKTRYEDLGGLTISMLKGKQGHQRKEIIRLTNYLRKEIKPDVILLTNVLLSGVAAPLSEELGVPVIATLQGDDIFLDALKAADREQCIAIIQKNSESLKGLIATSGFYADKMARYLGIDRNRIEVVWPGLNLKGHGGTRPPRHPVGVIGYLARIAPEKGFHLACEGFRILRAQPNIPPYRFHFSGWLGEQNRDYYEAEMEKFRAAGLANDVQHIPCPTLASKVEFLKHIDVLTVPTVYEEPKGLSILEAWANGTPVIQPAHGSFPELIAATQGGFLVPPHQPQPLAELLAEKLSDRTELARVGLQGQLALQEKFTDSHMAQNTMDVIQRFMKR